MYLFFSKIKNHIKNLIDRIFQESKIKNILYEIYILVKITLRRISINFLNLFRFKMTEWDSERAPEVAILGDFCTPRCVKMVEFKIMEKFNKVTHCLFINNIRVEERICYLKYLKDIS